MGNILIASDSVFTRLGIGSALERAGHEIGHVVNPTLAASGSDLSGVDLVVVDFEQPYRREEFIRRVHERDNRVRILALLGSPRDWLERASERSGAHVVVARPLGIADLVGQVQDMLNGGIECSE